MSTNLTPTSGDYVRAKFECAPPHHLTRPSKNGLPGAHVRTLKDGLIMLRKSDKNNVFQFPVPPNFRGLRGVYSDVIKSPMDLGTVLKQIDTKYRCVGCMCVVVRKGVRLFVCWKAYHTWIMCVCVLVSLHAWVMRVSCASCVASAAWRGCS